MKYSDLQWDSNFFYFKHGWDTNFFKNMFAWDGYFFLNESLRCTGPIVKSGENACP